MSDRVFKTRITEPLEFEVGESLDFKVFEFHSADSIARAQDVRNPEVFEGALLAIVVGGGSDGLWERLF